MIDANNPGGSATVGSIVFSLAPGGDSLAIGASGTPAAPDWYGLLPGNDIALGFENLRVNTADDIPVFSLGFEMAEPSAATMPVSGVTPVDSTYKVTLFNGGMRVAQFVFNVPDDVVAFVGVWSDTAFDRAEIIDTTGNADDEYFGEFYTGTIPKRLDSDGDGLQDNWEQFRIDTNGDGVIDLDLPKLGANPLRKDIFLEIDYMECSPRSFASGLGGDCRLNVPFHTHRPKDAAINAVVRAFDSSPVTNPDGSTGISLHIDKSNIVPHQYSFRPEAALDACQPTDPPNCGMENFDVAKADPANFGTNNPRRFAYHYAIFAHQQKSYLSPGNFQTISGRGELPGNDFDVTLGGWNTECISPRRPYTPLRTTTSSLVGDDVIAGNFVYAGQNLVCETTAQGGDSQLVPVGSRLPNDIDGDGLTDRDVGTVLQQAGSLMHELGHNLNLRHGGEDEVNNKPNYLSVMNYWFQTDGIASASSQILGFAPRIDYSRAVLFPLRERSL